MGLRLSTPHLDLRVWQDMQMGQLWRCAVNDGVEELVFSFPDGEALGDFIADTLGLELDEDIDFTEAEYIS